MRCWALGRTLQAWLTLLLALAVLGSHGYLVQTFKNTSISTDCTLTSWAEAIRVCASLPVHRRGVVAPAALANEFIAALATIEDGAYVEVRLRQIQKKVQFTSGCCLLHSVFAVAVDRFCASTRCLFLRFHTAARDHSLPLWRSRLQSLELLPIKEVSG